jgi:hypothetical protein
MRSRSPRDGGARPPWYPSSPHPCAPAPPADVAARTKLRILVRRVPRARRQASTSCMRGRRFDAPAGCAATTAVLHAHDAVSLARDDAPEGELALTRPRRRLLDLELTASARARAASPHDSPPRRSAFDPPRGTRSSGPPDGPAGDPSRPARRRFDPPPTASRAEEARAARRCARCCRGSSTASPPGRPPRARAPRGLAPRAAAAADPRHDRCAATGAQAPGGRSVTNACSSRTIARRSRSSTVSTGEWV